MTGTLAGLPTFSRSFFAGRIYPNDQNTDTNAAAMPPAVRYIDTDDVAWNVTATEWRLQQLYTQVSPGVLSSQVAWNAQQYVPTA